MDWRTVRQAGLRKHGNPVAADSLAALPGLDKNLSVRKEHMKPRELLLHHLKKEADHHAELAAEHTKLSKSHAAVGEHHTDQVLGQHHRDQSDSHARIAEQHSDHSRHMLQMHEHVSGIAGAELFPSHSDAGDELRDVADGDSLVKRFTGRAA